MQARIKSLAITRVGTRIDMAIILWRPLEPELLAASPIWVQLPPIHSIASRTTALVRFACLIGIEQRIFLVAKAKP
jgi:hypothetical protein